MNKNYPPDFLGYNLIWFIGEVEDREDPLKLGRVRVRAFGWHPRDKGELPTEHLPWAQTIQPVTAPVATPIGLSKGTWVTGFFMDGEKAQRPLVWGILPGYRFDSEGGSSESEIPRAARAEPELKSAQSVLRSDIRITGIGASALTGQTWDEPEEPQDKEYPNVQTISSESGFVKEIILNKEIGSRQVEYDGLGGYRETRSDGSNVIKIIGNNYEIICGDSFANIKGNVSLTIDGDCNTNILGNWNINVAGDKVESIGGNHSVRAAGMGGYVYGKGRGVNIATGNDKTTILAGSYSLTTAAGSIAMTSSSTINLKSTVMGLSAASALNISAAAGRFDYGAGFIDASFIQGDFIGGKHIKGDIVLQGSTILGTHIHIATKPGPPVLVSGPPK